MKKARPPFGAGLLGSGTTSLTPRCRSMAEQEPTQEEIDHFWRELGAKLRTELKRRGYDVETMSDAKFEELKNRLAMP